MTTSNIKSKFLIGEDDQQLQRIETLHQQLKAEQARAQELLAKLKSEDVQPPKPLLKEYHKQPKRLAKHTGGKKVESETVSLTGNGVYLDDFNPRY